MTAEVKVLFVLFLFFLLFALGSAIATLYLGGNALSSHLSYAPRSTNGDGYSLPGKPGSDVPGLRPKG